MTTAFDTNVYAYTLDKDAPSKRQIAIELLTVDLGNGRQRPLLWQVACEFLGFLRRQQAKNRIDEPSIRSEFDSLLANHLLITPSPEVLPQSLELKSRYSLSHWDSILLAAYISAGIDTLYSEDLSHGVAYESVTVLNPFLNP